MKRITDKNHTGLLPVNEASKDPVFLSFANYTGNIPSILNLKNNTDEDSAYRINTGNIPSILNLKNNTDEDSAYSINKELKPALVRQFEEYIKELNANQSSSPPIFHENVIPVHFVQYGLDLI